MPSYSPVPPSVLTQSAKRMCCKCCSVLQQKIWVITIGIVCTIIGIVLIVIWPGLSENIINNRLPLNPGTWRYKHWLHPPATSYMFLYLFNWTNMYDATSHNVKPNFVQMGPYVFREEKSKEDITWHDNDTLTFYGRRTWFFEKDMSIGSLDDLITMPHPPTVVVANEVRNWNRYMKKIMNFALKTEGGCLAVNKTVEEWLFQGFYDPLAEFAMLLESELIPWRYKEFGYFVGRNASKEYEGTYTINTGHKDMSILGEVTHWRGSNQSYAYRGECGRINGSTGDIFAPARGPHEVQSLFFPDVCGSINLYPTGRRRLRGMDTMKYSTNSMSFDSGDLYPNMECFCSEKTETCAPTGAMDLGPCLLGAPIYLSLPHFLNADPKYAETVTGLSPDPEEHSFDMDMETTLGVPVKVKVNLQLSMLLRDDDIVEIFKNVNEFYAPLVIISEQAELEESMAKLVRLALNASGIGVGIAIAILVIGVILLLIAVYLTYTKNWKGQKNYVL